MKKIVIIILILALNCQTKILVSQEINSKLPNAKIIEAVDGFLVYGNTKTQLYVKLYNNNLKIVDSIIQPMHKTSSRSIQVEKLSNGYYFEMKNCRLVIDNKCKKIDFKEWTRETIDSTKNAIGKENMQNYISESGAGFNKNRIYLEDMYIEIIKEYKYMHPFYGYVITESSYKGNPKIRCFTPNNIDVVCTYKFKWEIELKDKKIDDYKWYYFGENQLFLYFSESNYYQAYIYKINYNTGKIEFIYHLPSEDKLLVFSNLTIDKDGNLVIVGNYSNKKIPNIYEEGMNGWFITKLNSAGIELKSNYISFESKYLNNRTITESKVKLPVSKCLTFHSINTDASNNINLMGENIEAFKELLIPTQPSPYATPSHLYCWRTYALSSFILDENLNIIPNDYFSESFISFGTKNYLDDLVSNQSIFEVITAHEPIIINEVPMMKYALIDSYNSNDGILFIYKQYKESGNRYPYYYVSISSDGKPQNVFLKNGHKKSILSYFINSTKEIVEFESNKKGYTLKLLKI